MSDRKRKHSEQVIVRFMPEDKARIDRLVGHRNRAALIRQLLLEHLDQVEGVRAEQLELEGAA